ncbi:MAG TPA: DUF3943 domain-containing protein [Anaeromyxobacter sp.]|nr:DUF3943 domain-containing protein [Anaeromyxobacter sp.]
MSARLPAAAAAVLLLATAARAQAPAAQAAAPPDLAAAPPGSVPPLTPPPETLGRYAPTELGRAARWGWSFLEGPIGYSVVQNRFAYNFGNPEVYDVDWDNFVDHLDGPWWYDEDQFVTNQFGHPYEGSMYYTAARSMGLSFYESFLMAEIGSFLWETAGETEPPSVNDQITTPIAGSILGEVLYRLSSRAANAMRPGFWREISVAALSPFTGLNRQIVGDQRPGGRRFTDQPWFGQLRLSLGVAGRATSSGYNMHNPAGQVSIAARAQNGNPGSDWEFRGPFDYFDVAMSLVLDKNADEKKAYGNVMMRGLVLADDWGEGRSRGLWGLMAAYDYITPGSFRASSSSVAIGAVKQFPFSTDLALQGTAYAGIGYGAGGSSAEAAGFRDYHFGVQGVSLLEARLLWAGRGLLRLAGRSYYISSKASPETDDFEFIHWGEVEVLARVWGPHALAVTAIGARRRAQYTDVPDIRSRAAELMVSYTLVNDPAFGMGR